MTGLVRLQEIYTLSTLSDVTVKLQQLDFKNPKSLLNLFIGLKEAGEYRIVVDCHVTHIHLLLKKVRGYQLWENKTSIAYLAFTFILAGSMRFDARWHNVTHACSFDFQAMQVNALNEYFHFHFTSLVSVLLYTYIFVIVNFHPNYAQCYIV